MLASIHFFPSLLLFALGAALEFYVVGALLARGARASRVWSGAIPGALVLLMGYLLEFRRFAALFPVVFATWLDCAFIVEVLLLLLLAIKLAVAGRASDVQARRRAFLQTAVAAGLCAVPATATV